MLKQNSKTSLSLAILLATTMAGSAAHAAEQGLFAEVGAGLSTIDTGLDGLAGVSVDDEDMFFSIGGGYNFNKMFAVEAGYTDLGEAEISIPSIAYTATLSADGFYFGPRLTLELAPQFEAYGRIGMLAWDAEFNDSDGFTVSDDGTDVYLGIGAAFKISNQLSLGADWTRYMLESGGEDVDVDTFGGKLKFNF
jgi:hypothetical protein